MAFASLRPGAAGARLLLRGARAWAPAVGGVRWAWHVPSINCYALLGLTPNATAAQIKEAYLARAKKLHPDLAGEGSGAGSDKMAQLNLCYEALTRHRAEYDASRGVGGAGPRAQAYSAREPWWRRPADFEEEFEEMGRAWEDLHRGRQGGPGPGDRRSWRDWADAWRGANGKASAGRRRGGGGRGRRWQCETSSEESDTESDWDSDFEEAHFFRGRRRGGGQRQAFRQRREAEGRRRPQQEEEPAGRQAGGGRGQGRRSPPPEPPQQLWIGVQQRVRPGVPHTLDPFAGPYRCLEEKFGGRCAFLREGSPSLFLFWSEQFGDWKLAERLADDGACLAFAADERGRNMPWAPGRLRWKVWDPLLRRFTPRRVFCEALTEGSETAGDEDAGRAGRQPFAEWPTPELIRWCEEQGISLEGCFDRDSVLERAASAAAEGMGSAGSARQRPGGGGAKGPMRLASRVKTDGSYTRPPSLDPRVSVYGNRVEAFRGADPEILPWLEEYGDKSRLYGVFASGAFRYSLVWKRQKFWGRPDYRSAARREAYDR